MGTSRAGSDNGAGMTDNETKGRSKVNEAYENIMTRRSIRKYKPDMVEKELIDKVVEAGLAFFFLKVYSLEIGAAADGVVLVVDVIAYKEHDLCGISGKSLGPLAVLAYHVHAGTVYNCTDTLGFIDNLTEKEHVVSCGIYIRRVKIV